MLWFLEPWPHAPPNTKDGADPRFQAQRSTCNFDTPLLGGSTASWSNVADDRDVEGAPTIAITPPDDGAVASYVVEWWAQLGSRELKLGEEAVTAQREPVEVQLDFSGAIGFSPWQEDYATTLVARVKRLRPEGLATAYHTIENLSAVWDRPTGRARILSATRSHDLFPYGVTSSRELSRLASTIGALPEELRRNFSISAPSDVAFAQIWSEP